MIFQTLTVNQFRNHTAFHAELASDVHAFAGRNGIGKTNLLEALHYLAMTRGFRTARTADRDAVQQGSNYFFIEAAFQEQAQPIQLQCTYLEGKGKRLLVNGSALPRLSDHLGRIPVVALLPDDVELIRESGSTRRRWLDMLLSQCDPQYLQALIRYERALEQRNALLARGTEPGATPVSTDELLLWDLPLAEAGVVIAERRQQFLAAFQPYFAQSYHQIAEGRELPGVQYETGVRDNQLDGWLAALQQAQRADRSAGRTTWGTHRDDLLLTLNDQPVKGRGSQGQQKSFVIALKLAQHAYLHQQTGKPPLLLFDDVFDRLDAHRAARIFELLCTQVPGQKFLSDTSAERLRQALAPHSVSWEVTELEVTF